MIRPTPGIKTGRSAAALSVDKGKLEGPVDLGNADAGAGLSHRFNRQRPVSNPHLRAPEPVLDMVCRLRLKKKKEEKYDGQYKYN